MTPMQVTFLVVAAATLVSAVMVVSVRRLMHAALWLVLTLFGVAVLFAMLEAGFFAVVQVVVYIGAIAILVIFAVMLTRGVMGSRTIQLLRGWWWAALVAFLLFSGLIFLLKDLSQFQAVAEALPAGAGDVAALGQALASPDGFVLPFEVASVLLVAAMVGGIYLASERKG